MAKIVILNVYGYKNLGDGAILDSSIKVINKVYKNSLIEIHTANNFTINKDANIKTFLHPYGITIKNNGKKITDVEKIFKYINVFSISLSMVALGKIFPKFLPMSGDYSYIRSIKDGDTIIGIGGGYLRTKNKIKDYFGLTLTLLPIFIAHIYGKRVLFLPMSYGDFASQYHDHITFKIIKNDTIIFRDKKSLYDFNKHSNKKLDTHLAPDMALYDEYTHPKKIGKYIVLTAREWMKKNKQIQYEKDLTKLIKHIWKNYKLKTVFIPMVWNETEDNDNNVGNRINKMIRNKNIFEIKHPDMPHAVKVLLSNAQAAICTRMHSAILSTITSTPFITISYEHKTLGFLEHLSLEEWNVDINNFTYEKIVKKFDSLMNVHYESLTQNLKSKHIIIRSQERELIRIINRFEKNKYI